MNSLKIDVISPVNEIVRSASTKLELSDMSVIIDALVLLCDQLEVGIPLWTSVEERKLLKKKEVVFNDIAEDEHYVKVQLLAN